MYKIPPRMSSGLSPIRNILASQFISGMHDRTESQEEGGRFVPDPRNRFAGEFILGLFHSTSRVTLRRFIRSRAFVPVEYGQQMFHRSGMVDRQADKDDIDALKFMKVDCLALGMLTCMKRAFDFLVDAKGIELDLATIPSEDPRTRALLISIEMSTAAGG
jgi:hypothetical protein